MDLHDARAEAPNAATVVREVVARHGGDVHDLVQILREVQEVCDWISPEAIDCLVAELGVPRTKIEAVAGFYSFFYLVPRGAYRVLFSDNITDRMAGSAALKEPDVPQSVDRARQGFGRRTGQCRSDFLHRNVRSGPGDVG